MKVKRFLKKIASWAGVFFFGVAAYAIYHQLSKYDLEDIKDALLEIPAKNLIYACAASFCGYVALSSYDFLAIKYVGKKIAPWKWIFAGFIGFSISNNAGHAIVSGGAIRYRLYTRWRFRATEIVKMVTFSGFTYLIACFFLIIVGYIITPDHAFGEGSTSQTVTAVTALCSLIGLCVYLGGCLFYKKPIVIKDVEFEVPSIKMALAQIFIGAADILMASSVLYFSITAFIPIKFDVFIGVFIIAQVLGVFSQVPGGLGIFEGLFLYIIPNSEDNTVAIFGALIAYRIIYYLLPLLISGISFLVYEGYLRYRHKLILKNHWKYKQNN